jgi:hypothetical protein
MMQIFAMDPRTRAPHTVHMRVKLLSLPLLDMLGAVRLHRQLWAPHILIAT